MDQVEEQVNAKRLAERAFLKTQGSGGTVGLRDECGATQASPHSNAPSLYEDAQRQADYHRQEANKHARAAAFFRDYPAFEIFVSLIRSGAIQF